MNTSTNLTEQSTDLEQVGRIMHESWCKTKREQGFHGPDDMGNCTDKNYTSEDSFLCQCNLFHADLIPWEQLPEKQKDINRHAFDAILPHFITKKKAAEQVAALAALLIVNELGLYQKELEEKGESDAAIMCSTVKNVIAVKNTNSTEALAQRDLEMWEKGSLEAFNNIGRTLDLLQMDDVHDEDGAVGLEWAWNAIFREKIRVRQIALEEAAKTRCEYCQMNLRVEHQGEGNNYWHWDKDKGGFILPCKASPIRALIEKEKE